MGSEAHAHRQHRTRNGSSHYNANANANANYIYDVQNNKNTNFSRNGRWIIFVWLLVLLTWLTQAKIFVSNRIIPEILDYDYDLALPPAVVTAAMKQQQQQQQQQQQHRQAIIGESASASTQQQTSNNYTVPLDASSSPSLTSSSTPPSTSTSTSTLTSLEQGGVTSNFSVPPSEWVKDISSLISCGGYKCVFRSHASEHYGYSVSQQLHRDQSLDDLVRATDLAQQLSEAFHIRHLLVGHPLRLNITKEQISEKGMDDLAMAANQRRRIRFLPTDPSDLENTQLIVQPIELAPKDSFVFGCAIKKKKFAMETLQSYLANTTAMPAAKRLKFVETMLTDLDASARMVNSTMGSCMKYDFQLLIDPSTGNFYHFDIDRCFDKNVPIENHKEWGWKKCFKNLRQYTFSLLESSTTAQT